MTPEKFTPEKRPIQVWRWEDAPDYLKAFSQHGGDEDWVALVPAEDDFEIPWLESPLFGGCDVSRVEMENGDIVFIGAHA
jgi:hypothetical protein